MEHLFFSQKVGGKRQGEKEEQQRESKKGKINELQEMEVDKKENMQMRFYLHILEQNITRLENKLDQLEEVQRNRK